MKSTPHHIPAVVIGLDSMQGIQTARILRRHRIPVIAVASDRDHPCCRTNCCQAIHFADTGDEQLIAKLLEIAAALPQKPVLFPCQDKSVRTVSRNRDVLAQRFTIVLPPADVVEKLMDKISFLEHAQRHGLRVPATFVLRTRADALHAAEKMPFPCLLKPGYRSAEWDRRTKQKVYKVASAQELIALYDQCHAWADSLVAQQWVEGDDSSLYSCNCYFGANGEPLVTFVARKLRQWPPEAGSSCLGEEVRDDTVRDGALALFASVPYRGLAYLEMKKDSRTGVYYLIEPNIGRPTGRSAIAEAGGVELVYTMYCDALGLPLPANRTQKFIGARWVDLRHDFQSALYYWRRGRLTLRQWFSSWRGRKAHAIFSWRDPVPFLCDVKKALTMALAKRWRRRSAAALEQSPREA
ncbi:MAG TPA: carboxylate--amine ligase [Planctomycetota bacterium]